MRNACVVAVLAAALFGCEVGALPTEHQERDHHHKHGKHHGHHGAKRHKHHHLVANATVPGAAPGSMVLKRMREMENEVVAQEKTKGIMRTGELHLQAPLPADFSERFRQAVAKATGCMHAEVQVTKTKAASAEGVVDVHFEAPAVVVDAVLDQAADPGSELAKGPLGVFLRAREGGAAPVALAAPPAAAQDSVPAPPAAAAVSSDGQMDVDMEMPYGDIEPFGREDTAQELTESSVRESNEMVDQLERAEVAEEKRAVFRALTRLRGAAIASFDGVARAQTGNIDEYNKVNKWRNSHPLNHLANEESDVSKWAFPNEAD